jgi:hypothetical protein
LMSHHHTNPHGNHLERKVVQKTVVAHVQEKDDLRAEMMTMRGATFIWYF